MTHDQRTERAMVICRAYAKAFGIPPVTEHEFYREIITDVLHQAHSRGLDSCEVCLQAGQDFMDEIHPEGIKTENSGSWKVQDTP